jgi:hypothetical protein
MRTIASRRARGFVALCAAGAFLAWSFMNALGVFGAPTAPQASAASAYEYQYQPSSVAVTGSGSIAGPNGTVNFDITAKDNMDVTSGSCTVNEPKSKTKIKCLDVTSLDFTDLGNGVTEVLLGGTATINGVTTTYTIRVRDAGSPGTGDSFAIDADGFHRSGVLTGGNLSIRFTP